MAKRQAAIVQSVDDSKAVVSATLRDEVKQALLNVLRDSDASAAAKASAGRTLLEYFSDDESSSSSSRRGAEMTAAELDAEIARLDT